MDLLEESCTIQSATHILFNGVVRCRTHSYVQLEQILQLLYGKRTTTVISFTLFLSRKIFLRRIHEMTKQIPKSQKVIALQ